MRRILSLLVLALTLAALPAWAADCAAAYGNGAKAFSLATGSPGELGLLEELAKAFNAKNGSSMCWVKAGSGQSLKLLKDKQVDMIMVHAPAAEKAAVAEGWAVGRTLIGSNEFFIVGPKADPAGVAQAKDAADAYARIAKAQARFFSRGDNSGTHKKELDAWRNAGIEPAGDWYVITKDFMMATLKRADAEGGYFMTDSSTWISARKELGNLVVLFRGDTFLVNTYHTLAQPAGATPGQATAMAFVEFVGSPDGQKIIAGYGAKEYGEGIYNDAAYARKYDK
ncbi:MAG: substrate-binding domain-containing protein [Thermodesulfobacteriota bacterium]